MLRTTCSPGCGDPERRRLTGRRPSAHRLSAPRRLPVADAASFVHAGLRDALTQYLITAEIEAPAETVRGRIGRWAEVVESTDAHCTVRLRTDSMEWAVLALGMTGVDFRVISPPEFCGYIAEWAVRSGRAAARPAREG